MSTTSLGPILPLLSVLLVAGPLAAQSGVKLSGYGEASYSYANNASGNAIVGRLYDRFANQFTLNGLKLVVERAAAADKWDAGVRADFVFGQNAAVLQSAGLNLGNNGDLTQLFVTLNVPTANKNGIQFKVGKIVTLMGLEVIETVANPNWSEGLQFIYVENFAHTGLEVGHRFSSAVDVQLRVGNMWDRVVATDGHHDFMARIGLAPSATTSIGVIGHAGAQQPGSNALRSGLSVLLNQKFGATSFWVQADYGTEEANGALPDPTQNASWTALGAWLAFDVNPKLGVALRGDYLNDANGARTTGAYGLAGGGVEHQLWSLTGTLNVKAWPGALVRPELRVDHSSFPVFDGSETQMTLAFSVAYIF